MKNIIYENKNKPVFAANAESLCSYPHLHKEIEFIVALNGNSYPIVDHKKEPMKSGDIFIAFPNQIHYYDQTVKGEYILAICLPDIFFGLKNILYDNIPTNNIVTCPEAVKLFKNATEICGDYSDTLKIGLINQALGIILSSLELKPRIKTDNSTLQSILNYCIKNYASDLTLDSVSESLHLSRFYISHLINDKIGLSFNNYLNIIRINNACDMLESSDTRIADISENSGFGSIRSFNRAFQSIMNITPIEYRKQFKISSEAEK